MTTASKRISTFSIVFFLIMISPYLVIETLVRAGVDILVVQPVPKFFGNKLGNLFPNKVAFAYSHPEIPFHYTTDSDGFRSNGFKTKKHLNHSILCLGDSYTFGIGVKDDASFPAQLAFQIDSSEILPGFKVINAGAAGTGIKDHLLYYLDKAKQIKPDLVVLQFSAYDLGLLQNKRSYRTTDTAEKYSRVIDDLYVDNISKLLVGNLSRFVPNVLMSSVFSSQSVSVVKLSKDDIAEQSALSEALTLNEEEKSLVSNRGKILDERYIEKSTKVWNRFTHYLLQIKNAVNANGSDFLFVIIPDVHQTYTYINGPGAALIPFCKENGIKYIDLAPVFRSLRNDQGVSPFFEPFDFHCNVTGNAIVATEIVKRILPVAEGKISFTPNEPSYRYNGPIPIELHFDDNGDVSIPANDILEIVSFEKRDVELKRVAGGGVKYLTAKTNSTGFMSIKFKAKQSLEQVTVLFFPHIDNGDNITNKFDLKLSSKNSSSGFSTSLTAMPSIWKGFDREANLECKLSKGTREFEVHFEFLRDAGFDFEDTHLTDPRRRLELYIYPVQEL